MIFTKKWQIFVKTAEPNFGGKLTERSAEPVRSILAERSAEPFGFGRTLLETQFASAFTLSSENEFHLE